MERKDERKRWNGKILPESEGLEEGVPTVIRQIPHETALVLRGCARGLSETGFSANS